MDRASFGFWPGDRVCIIHDGVHDVPLYLGHYATVMDWPDGDGCVDVDVDAPVEGKDPQPKLYGVTTDELRHLHDLEVLAHVAREEAPCSMTEGFNP